MFQAAVTQKGKVDILFMRGLRELLDPQLICFACQSILKQDTEPQMAVLSVCECVSS